ncbi:MAG TPA: PAS domain-containing protein [Nitrospira sp.]|nr:PAS domain-containing protein [Nitrospira sp.]
MPSKSAKKAQAKKTRSTVRSSKIPATAAKQSRTRRSHGPFERDGTVEIASLARAHAALRQSNERFRTFLDHAPSLAFVKGTDGRYLYANRKFEEVFGFQSGTVLGKTDVELFPRDQADQFQSYDQQVLDSGQAIEFEETAAHADGLHTSIVVKFPLRDAVGQIYAIGGIVTDITERKRVEEALKEKEELTSAFLENPATLAWMKDADGRYVYLGSNFASRFGIRPEDGAGKTDFELWPRDMAERYRENDLLVLRQNLAVEVVEEAQGPDGECSWWLSYKFPFEDASGRRYVGGLGVDITDRKRAEMELQLSQDELRQHRGQLQSLTSKLFTAQERERQRISCELHDDVSQRLAALVLDVASLEQQPPLMPEFVVTALEPIRNQLEQLADDIHSLAYKLHPSLLEHAGLQPAIEDHIHQVTQRMGLRITLEAEDLSGWLSLDQATCLFRVLQESLQNIVKHANATDVMVRLNRSPKGVGLSVTDNGRGFDGNDKNGHQKGLGVISMQERLRLLNGFLRIHSRPDEGTKVCAWIPFQKGAS